MATIGLLERIGLNGELQQLLAQLSNAPLLEKIGKLGRIMAILRMLGLLDKTAESSDVGEGEARRDTSGFYSVRVKGSTSRQKLNERAVALMERIKGEERVPTDEERAELAKFSGYGGGLIDPVTGQKGSAYEYYTPKPVAEAVWGLLGDIGFKGGKVLDPSSGTGIFGATAPKSCVIDAVELSEQSGTVNKLVNDGPGYKTTICAFEKFASTTPDETYDAVVTNVPFGNLADRGTNRLEDKRYQEEPLENYFILRSLEKLRPNGMAAFIVPTRCVSGKGGKPEELRIAASQMAEFVGAYRLPTGTFSSADTDTVTDIIFFRKFGEEARQKIDELREQNPQVLIDAKVNWTPFISGKYFESAEGAKYVIGEFQAKDADKFRDVDKVIFNGDLSAIVRELRSESRALPKSRIDWEMLSLEQTMPIAYEDGDRIRQAGRTYTMRNGTWVVAAESAVERELVALSARFKDPYTAWKEGVTLEDARRLNASGVVDLPLWAQALFGEIDKAWETEAPWDFEKRLRQALVAGAVKQVLDERSADIGVNYLKEYKDLSEALRCAGITKATATKATGANRIALTLAYSHFNKKVFSDFWRGDVKSEVVKNEAVANALETEEAKIARLQYESLSPWLDLDKVRAIKGEKWEPFADDEYCVSGDGKKVIRAADYYVGNLAAFIDRIDREIANAQDQKLKEKLLRQKIDAGARVRRVNVEKMTFNLFSSGITVEEKVAFLRKFVSPLAAPATDERGRQYPDIVNDKQGKTDIEKLHCRYGDYLKTGTVTLGGMSFDFGLRQKMLDALKAKEEAGDDKLRFEQYAREQYALLGQIKQRAFNEMRKLIAETDTQFNAWVHGQPQIMERISNGFNSPTKLRFIEEEDNTPLDIPGLNPRIKLHGYQTAFVRKMGREFSGINGFGVGLGKTFTALAAVQHVQAMGAKNKTIFIVPNSTFSNWRNEARTIYTSIDDCLFVGLVEAKNGKVKNNPANYATDLWKIKENRHSKIFMTKEAFAKLRVKKETLEQYADYIRSTDNSYGVETDKKKDERNKGRLSKMLKDLTSKESAAPFLEELGIDSIVIDEAHVFKNSVGVGGYAGAKYLSVDSLSGCGLDAQMKCWYIRGATPSHDGVLMLTATPITNSPLEIRSMLTLAVGNERVNDACGVNGVDEFLRNVCNVANQDDISVAGMPTNASVFLGLKNASALRQALSQVVTVKDASDVGMSVHVPERDAETSKVELDESAKENIALYKMAYRYAKEYVKVDANGRLNGDTRILADEKLEAAFWAVQQKFNETPTLMAHPFNLLNKISHAILDPDLDRLATFYKISETQIALAEKVVAEFNALRLQNTVNKLSPYSKDYVAKGAKKPTDKKSDAEGENDDEGAVSYIVYVNAKIDGNQIVIDTRDPETQSAFEKIADKYGLVLNVTISPKVAALIENVKKEMANPRGIGPDGQVSPIVKQLIFCDEPAIHNKLKRVLSQRAGIPAGKITFITGRINGKPEELQDVQDGFNAFGDDNKYCILIANEKAEVGINLQKGTQAIHHLTVGWTPDSVEQRNGRGARQGNKIERVSIYFYEASGSFDVIKRRMLDHKASWINQLVSDKGGEEIEVNGGISKEMQEKMALSDGSERAMQEILDAQEAEAKRARINQVRESQMTNLKTALIQQKYLRQNKRVDNVFAEEILAAWRTNKALEAAKGKLGAGKLTDRQKSVLTVRRDELQAELDRLTARLDSSITLSTTTYHWDGTERVADQHEGLSGFLTYLSYAGAKTEKQVQKALSSALGLGGSSWRKSYDVVRINQEGEIVKQWKQEQELAKCMIDESLKAFDENKDKEGAYPPVLAALVKSGEAALSESGYPLILGSALRIGGKIFLITSVTGGGSDAWAHTYEERTKRGYVTAGIESMNGLTRQDIVYPEEPGYDEYVKAAAETEDLNLTPEYPFSKAIGAVAALRKNKDLVFCNAEYLKLPPPYFPYVITPKIAAQDAVLAEIAKSQSDVVRAFADKYHDDDMVYITPDTEVVQGTVTTAERSKAILAYCEAHGKRISFKAYRSFDPYGRITDLLPVEKFKEGLSGAAATVEEISEAAARSIEAAIPWLRVDSLPDFLENTHGLYSDALNGAKQRLLSQTDKSFINADDDKVNGGVTGETYAVKDDLKMIARALGDRAYWDAWHQSWTVTRATWKLIQKMLPEASKNLVFAEA